MTEPTVSCSHWGMFVNPPDPFWQYGAQLARDAMNHASTQVGVNYANDPKQSQAAAQKFY